MIPNESLAKKATRIKIVRFLTMSSYSPTFMGRASSRYRTDRSSNLEGGYEYPSSLASDCFLPRKNKFPLKKLEIPPHF